MLFVSKGRMVLMVSWWYIFEKQIEKEANMEIETEKSFLDPVRL